jgi:hypothetical protein
MRRRSDRSERATTNLELESGERDATLELRAVTCLRSSAAFRSAGSQGSAPGGSKIPEMSSAVTLGVTGIVVSGIAGPAVSAWFSRRGDQQRFARDQRERRREDLRSIVDEGAVILGAGGTNLRLANEAAVRGDPEPAEVSEWASRAHLLGQRLLLRLAEDHPVVVAYQAVVAALLEVGDSYGDEDRYQETTTTFEATRNAFLDNARRALARTETT